MERRQRNLLFWSLFAAVVIYMITLQINHSFFKPAWSLPLSGQVFVIDPGHGGPDGGAVSQEGTVEKEVSLAIGIYLRDFLQEQGALVLMTREKDIELSSEKAKRLGKRKAEDLQNRVDMINEADADMLISLHVNSIDSAQWRGAQTFYNPQLEASRQMALSVQNELVHNLENTTREAKANQDIFILRHAQIPGILVEMGFLSNPQEAELLETVEYQKQMALSIYEGIMRYYAESEANLEE